MSYWPLILCIASTFYLTGLIWVIQLVHYPLFARVGPDEFEVYHLEHSQRIVLALSVPVLLVFVNSVLLLWIRPVNVPDWTVWLNLAFTLAFWFLTAAVQIPIHNKLGNGFEVALVKKLVVSNWWRTLLWTAQGGLLVGMLIAALPAV